MPGEIRKLGQADAGEQVGSRPDHGALEAGTQLRGIFDEYVNPVLDVVVESRH